VREGHRPMTRRAQAYRPLRRSDELLARVMLAGPALPSSGVRLSTSTRRESF